MAQQQVHKPGETRRKRNEVPVTISSPVVEVGPFVWLRAEYTAHVFHYRMPDTVAIASVNPLIPSPLTVKMAILATLLRDERVDEARRLAAWLAMARVLIQPPDGAITFKAFMRYVRVPAEKKAGEIDAATGGLYGVSPHIREYAIWDGSLAVFVETPERFQPIVVDALLRISYLGAKDSQVTCLGVSEVTPDERQCAQRTQGVTDFEQGGVVVRLAEWVNAPDDLIQAIPTQRRETDYRTETYVMPGTLHATGKSKVYRRYRNSRYSFSFVGSGPQA